MKKWEFEIVDVAAVGHLFISAKEEGKVECRESGEERAECKGRNERDEEEKEEKEEKVYIHM